MSTLYIFGSGFLCDLGYPLGGRMYNIFLKWCKFKSKQPHLDNRLKYKEEIDVVEKYWNLKEGEFRNNYNKKINVFMNSIYAEKDGLLRRDGIE